MCSTHEVNCKRCGSKIAWWSMFDNIQHQSEWECSSFILNYERNKSFQKNKIVSNRTKSDKKIENDINKLNLSGNDWTFCSLLNGMVFCGKCASELNYICPSCGGKIIQIRDANGYTIHD